MSKEEFAQVVKPKKTPAAVRPEERWGADVIVDMLLRYQLPYAALNPGASYRGLHDSIVNYGNNTPQMMLCQHEETAVQVAHGYAKASGGTVLTIVDAARVLDDGDKWARLYEDIIVKQNRN